MIHVANAPCSWGVLEFDSACSPPDYARVLDEIASTGYAGTELGEWGFMPTEAGALRAELTRRSLALVAAFVPVSLADPLAHDAGEAAAIRTARLLAASGESASLLVLSDHAGCDATRTRHAGRVRPDHALPAAAWDTLIEGVGRIARRVWETTGVRTAFHPHCASYVETPDETAALLARTDPGLLGLCLDTGHLTYGGADMLDILRRYGDRVWHVHFKDCHPEVAAQAREGGWDYFTAIREGLFCELGSGNVNFAAITAALGDRAYDGWIVVEQDVLPQMGTPAASARQNREYLRSIGL